MHRSVRDKLLIKLDPSKDEMAAILVSMQKEKATTGTVISVGKLIDEVVPGDRVAFSAFAGFATFLEDGEYRTLKIDDVMLLLDKEMQTPQIHFHTDRKKAPVHQRGVIQTFN